MEQYNKYWTFGMSHGWNKNTCVRIIGFMYDDLKLPLSEKIKAKQLLRNFLEDKDNKAEDFNDYLLSGYDFNAYYSYLDIFKHCLHETLNNKTN